MTREEAIERWIKPACKNTWNEKKCKEIFAALEQEPCEDVISRADVILQIQRHGVGCFDPDEFSPEVCERFVIDLISKLPSYRIESDDKESTEGHLTLLTECANSGYYCSECHKKLAEERSDVKQIKFCSKCGIKIVGAVEKL